MKIPLAVLSRCVLMKMVKITALATSEMLDTPVARPYSFSETSGILKISRRGYRRK
jgi:hypothetical protein